MMVEFFVDGKPQGKGRAKYSARGSFVRAYTPAKTRTYEQHIKECAQNALGCPTSEFMGEVRMIVVAHFLPPKAASKKKKAMMIDKLVPHLNKPDLDNIAKCVCDALNKVLYQDDSQIVSLHLSKSYSDIEGLKVVLYQHDEDLHARE